MSEYLSLQELHQITGYARARQQAAWLAEQRIPHRLDGRRVILSRLHVQAWLQGRNSVTSGGPNWGVVK